MELNLQYNYFIYFINLIRTMHIDQFFQQKHHIEYARVSTVAKLHPLSQGRCGNKHIQTILLDNWLKHGNITTQYENPNIKAT